ncbi:MAG: cytochrome c family protein [Gammaproteobacteria bacterium]|nr:cytochrome c family protein [Gammaproteobacteria bacterium]
MNSVFKRLWMLLLLLPLSACFHNTAPIADAGQDRDADLSSVVELDGGASWDPNGDELSFYWRIESWPSRESEAAFDNANLEKPKLSIDIAGIYEISLRVSDGEQSSEPDVIRIYVGTTPNKRVENGYRPEHVPVYSDCLICHGMNLPLQNHVVETECEKCHVFASWQLTIPATHPLVDQACYQCHNGTDADTRPASHISSSLACGQCHSLNDWQPIGIDHQQLLGSCASCHTTSSEHPVADRECARCHLSDSWLTIRVVPHPQLDLVDPNLGQCYSCHVLVSGELIARTKPEWHLATTNRCEACHILNIWNPVRVDHNQVLGVCASCHGLTQQHEDVKESCEFCHSTISWLQVSTKAHPAVNQLCIDCHNNIQQTGKSNSHLMSSEFCNACHQLTSWLPTWFDHSQTNQRCFSCHDGMAAAGRQVAHIKTTDECGACHHVSVWVPVLQVEHAYVLGPCIECHVAANSPAHVNVRNDCDECHVVRSWREFVNGKIP